MAAVDPDAWSARLLQLRRPANLFQPFNDTGPDRYPEVFSFLADRLGSNAGPRVLSFGCSTGEEVWSVRRSLPAAHLIGMDISRRNIATCRRRLRRAPDPRMSFRQAGDVSWVSSASLDAVLCMAVFRHGDLSRPGTQTCARLMTFATFEATVADLDRCLRPGGLLAIEHSNFRFADTAVAARYETVLSLARGPDPRTPLFGSTDRLLPGASYGDIIFQKG
jgi:SAM-dependent methyltransferase